MNFNPIESQPPGAVIKVIGIGGGGGNAVNTMINTGVEGVSFISVNTDIQALKFSQTDLQIQIGRELTKGLGAGADPDIGRDAALEDRHAIQEALEGANMVFVTAGMGGGTGTGGASIVAQIARELGALTVGVVTKPFTFEGKRRRRIAEIGIERLKEQVDTLITIPNQRLLQVAKPDLSMVDAFRMADNVLVNAVRGISDIINVPGTVNVDFADVKTVMSSMGLALMGIGLASGDDRAIEAANQAISSPLLEDIDIEGATGVLINISGGQNLTLMEVNQACCIIQEAAHEDANIIFGAVVDESLGNEIRVTVIATGFPSEEELGDFSTQQKQFERVPTFQISSESDKRQKERRASSKSEFLGKKLIPNRIEKSAHIEEKKPVESFESQELARLTMNQSESNQADNFKLNPNPEIESLSSESVEENISKEKIYGATVADNVLSTAPKEDDLTINNSEPPIYVTEHQDFDQKSEPSAFIASDSEKEDSILGTDTKLDEAIELADRIKDNDEKTSEEDDLDVPAFLRNGMKDLSLT